MNSLEALESCSDIWMDIEAQFDRTVLTVREILELARGSLIRFDRSAGEHLELFVGGAHIGRGEIVAGRNVAAFRIAELREEA